VHKFTVTYTKPDDVDGFLEHYENRHMPIVHRWPGVNAIRVTRFTGTPRGGEPNLFLQVDVLFDDEEELTRALQSDAGRESGKDAVQMVERFGVQADMLTGEEDNLGPGGNRPTTR
jgi:uncharacterized protein (TIGR02118 family)